MRAMIAALLLGLVVVAGCSNSDKPAAHTGKKKGMVVDPVCKMEVDPATAPREEYNGKMYYFCWEGCEENFKKNPTAYVKPAAGAEVK